MTDHDELLLYTLGQLSPDRAAALEAQLATDPALQTEARAQAEALGLLLDDLDLNVPVPPDAEDRLMARIYAEKAGAQTSVVPAPITQAELISPDLTPSSPARRPNWWLTLPFGLAAALALFFVLRPPADPVQQYASTSGATTQTITAGGQSLGKMVRLADGRVFIRLEQAAQAGHTYQLWHIQNGKPMSLGVFNQAGLLTAPLPAGTTLAVSLEPPGGSPQPTTKPLFAQNL